MKSRAHGSSPVYGVLQLSAPGYSWDNRRAIVRSAVECGYLCGYGRVYILEKDGPDWKIVEIIDTWES